MTHKVVIFAQATFSPEQVPENFSLHIESDPSALDKWRQDPDLFALVVETGQGIDWLKSLCEAAQNDETLFGVRILAVTPNESGMRLAALQVGADDLLTAPLDQVELMHTLKRLPTRSTVILQEAGDYDVLGHDLKGPLGTVISSLDLILSFLENDETLHPLVIDCQHTARREHMLLENLIDFLRIQDDNMHLELAATPLPPILDAFVEHATPTAERRGIQISVDTSGEIPEAYVDHRYLRRILDALFDNAIKFCTRGCEIKVKVQPNGQQLCLKVIDNGRPIPAQYEQQIFGQKQQLTMRVSGSRSSVAANLPFARAAARMMGGDLQAKSEGGWTAFSLTVPIAEK